LVVVECLGCGATADQYDTVSMMQFGTVSDDVMKCDQSKWSKPVEMNSATHVVEDNNGG
jgi:hypothetical protein